MPNFLNPFVANVPRTMSNQELAQAIRIDLGGELEAIMLYEAHAEATDDEVAAKVLRDIADEEKEHMGELLALLQYLDGEEGALYVSGMQEVQEMMEDLGVKVPKGVTKVIDACAEDKKAA